MARKPTQETEPKAEPIPVAPPILPQQGGSFVYDAAGNLIAEADLEAPVEGAVQEPVQPAVQEGN